MEKMLDGNYTRMLWGILNKSWRQHPTKQHLYGHLPPITKTIWIRWNRHAGHCWRGKDELISDRLLWPTSQDDQLEPLYNSSVQIQDTALKTPWEQWMIETGCKRRSRRSLLAAWHDDDDMYDGFSQCIHDRIHILYLN